MEIFKSHVQLTLYFYWPSLAWTPDQLHLSEPPPAIDHTLFLQGVKTPSFSTSMPLLTLLHFSCPDFPSYPHVEIWSLFKAERKYDPLWEYFFMPLIRLCTALCDSSVWNIYFRADKALAPMLTLLSLFMMGTANPSQPSPIEPDLSMRILRTAL